jgi:hypothetical protein
VNDAEKLAKWEGTLRSSVPDRWKEWPSPVGAAQNYIAELEVWLQSFGVTTGELLDRAQLEIRPDDAQPSKACMTPPKPGPAKIGLLWTGAGWRLWTRMDDRPADAHYERAAT